MSITDIEAPVAPQPRAAVSVSGRPYELMSAVRGLGRELWSDPVSFVGFVILLSLVLTAIFAPLIAPYDPATQSLRARLLPPFWLPRGSMAHLLGTDYLGRDVLSRLIHGSRASLGIGASVVALAGSFGVVMGLVAGYAGGRTDNIIMRAIDTQIAFPGLLLALIILATIGPTTATVIVVLALNGYYNGMTWKTQDWVVQSGDPTGDGRGGPGYNLPDEPNSAPKWDIGAVGMARPPGGPINGSQFFIERAAWPGTGPTAVYNRFGTVIKGIDKAELLTAPADRINSITIQVS